MLTLKGLTPLLNPVAVIFDDRAYVYDERLS